MNALLEVGVANALIATALAVVVWGVTRIVRQPAIVHALWLLVLVKLVTPPIMTIHWQWPRPNDANSRAVSGRSPDDAGTVSVFSHPAPGRDGRAMLVTEQSFDSDLVAAESMLAASAGAAVRQTPIAETARLSWVDAVAWLWFGGSVCFLMAATFRVLRFHRALRSARPAPDDLQQLAGGVAARLGVAHYQLRMTESRLAPLVWPVGRPTIVLSRPLIEQFSPMEIQTLLAHELAHLRRKDHWVRWLELAVTVLYWWHPIMWWARTMIHRAEEQLCDAWTVWAFPDDVRRYATTLFTAVQFASECRQTAPIVASRLGAGQNLKERIEHIMNATWNRRLSGRGTLILMLVALLFLPLSLRAAQSTNERPAESTAQGATSRDDKSTPTNDQPQIGPAPASSPNAALQYATNNADADIWREQVAFLEEHFKKVDALHKSGAAGGSPDELELAAYEVARARAELALAEGNAAEALTNMKNALQHADEALKAVSARYSAGTATSDRLYQTARKLFDAKRQLLQAHGQLPDAQPQNLPLATSMGDSDRLMPGDRIRLDVIGESPNNIDGVYFVEPGGTVALGARYGRVKVSELRPVQAELEIQNSLQKLHKDVKVQVTTAQQRRSGPPPGNSPTTSNAPAPVDSPAAAAPKIDLAHELGQLSQSAQPTDSIGVLKTIVENKKRALDRISPLADQSAVSQTELEKAKAEFEISLARLQQAQRGAQYRKRLVDLAQLEFETAVEANQRVPGSISDVEIRRLQIMVELARLKYAELAE